MGNDARQEGVEVRGSSPFKLMRVLCSKFGWTTDGEVVSAPAPGDRTAAMLDAHQETPVKIFWLRRSWAGFNFLHELRAAQRSLSSFWISWSSRKLRASSLFDLTTKMHHISFFHAAAKHQKCNCTCI